MYKQERLNLLRENYLKSIKGGDSDDNDSNSTQDLIKCKDLAMSIDDIPSERLHKLSILDIKDHLNGELGNSL
jgi:hypothetical protein